LRRQQIQRDALFERGDQNIYLPPVCAAQVAQQSLAASGVTAQIVSILGDQATKRLAWLVIHHLWLSAL
jgi:hypothetical protein